MRSEEQFLTVEQTREGNIQNPTPVEDLSNTDDEALASEGISLPELEDTVDPLPARPRMELRALWPPAVNIKEDSGDVYWPEWSEEEKKSIPAEKIFKTLEEMNPIFVNRWMGRYDFSSHEPRFEGHPFPAPKVLRLHGQTFEFDYLGAGGMATAYLGVSRETGEKVVMKVIKIPHGRPSEFINTLRREVYTAREVAAQAVLHPGRDERGRFISRIARGIHMTKNEPFTDVEAAHFPAFFDAVRLHTTKQLEKNSSDGAAGSEVSQEAVAIFMEYVEGGSFLKEMTSRGQENARVFSEGDRFQQLDACSRAVSDVIDILEAVVAMNSRGLRHRDIKPGNLMRGSDGHLNLLDFGLTKDERPSVTIGLSEVTRIIWGKILHDAYALYALVAEKSEGLFRQNEAQAEAKKKGTLLPEEEQVELWQALHDVTKLYDTEVNVLSPEEKTLLMRDLVVRLQELVDRYSDSHIPHLILTKQAGWQVRTWDRGRMEQYLAALPTPSGGGTLMENISGDQVPSRRVSIVETMDDRVVGTPRYLAPEQARAEVPKEWTDKTKIDVFPTGVILMYLLGCGRIKHGGGPDMVMGMMEKRAHENHAGLEYRDRDFHVGHSNVEKIRERLKPEAQEELDRRVVEFKQYTAIPDTFMFVRQLTAASLSKRPTPKQALEAAYRLKFKIENEKILRRQHQDAWEQANRLAAG